jgi:hypothetical protein
MFTVRQCRVEEDGDLVSVCQRHSLTLQSWKLSWNSLHIECNDTGSLSEWYPTFPQDIIPSSCCPFAALLKIRSYLLPNDPGSYPRRPEFNLFSPKLRNQLRSAFFWVITQRVAVIPYRRFGTIYRCQLQGLIKQNLLGSWDLRIGTDRLSRNVVKKLQLLAAVIIQKSAFLSYFVPEALNHAPPNQSISVFDITDME